MLELKEEKPHRYAELDALRGLAALAVVINHLAGLWAGHTHWEYRLRYLPIHMISPAGEAVFLFFVLSGFVLAVPFQQRQPAYLQYMAKRIARIYLPYAAAISLAMLGCWLFRHPATGIDFADNTWLTMPTWQEVKNIYLLVYRYPLTLHPVDPPAWSLAHEMRISIVFPAVFWLAKRVKTYWQMLLVVLASIAGRLLLHHMNADGLRDTVLYTGLFIFGAALFLHVHAIGNWLQRQSQWMRLGFAAAAFVLFEFGGFVPQWVTDAGLRWNVSWMASDGHFIWNSCGVWLVTLGAGGIMMAAIYITPLRHFLHHKFILHLGAISYSLYLTHCIAIWTVLGLLWGRVSMMWILACAVPPIVILAEGFHYSVERPAIQLGRWLDKRLVKKTMAAV